MFGVMCLLYIKTKNIWTNIAVHALNNLIATSMQFIKYQFLNYKRKVIYGLVWSCGCWITLVNSLRLETMAYSKRSWCATIRFINEEKVVNVSQENEVYSQVIVTDRLMAVELPDEAVNKLRLEENDYVKVFVEEDTIVIKKAHDK